VVVDLQIIDQGWHVCMGRHRTCGLPRYVRFLKDAFGPKSRPFPLSDIILIRAICSPTSSLIVEKTPLMLLPRQGTTVFLYD